MALRLLSRRIPLRIGPRVITRFASNKPSTGAEDSGKLQDPWILPAQINPADSASSQDPVTYTPHPLDGPRDSDENVKTLRSRLVYQTRKRGTLETGLLLSSFATSERIDGMGKEELHELDRLLAIPEWTIYYWAIGKQSPPDGSEWSSSKLLEELRQHSKNTEKEPRVMPELPH